MPRFICYSLSGILLYSCSMLSYSNTGDYGQICYDVNSYYAQDTLGIHLRNNSSRVCRLKSLIVRNGEVLLRQDIDVLTPGIQGELAISGWKDCDKYIGIDVDFIYSCNGKIVKFENVLPHSNYWGRNTILSMVRHVDRDIELGNKDISPWGRSHSGHVIWSFSDAILVFDSKK